MSRPPRNAAANRAVEFINHLTATGDYDGQPFTLRPWQEKLVRQIFGTLRPDGTRQYRQCLLFLPRKNGKSSFAAVCALAELFSGKSGQQILIVAGDRNQASITFDIMLQMLEHPSAKRLLDKLQPNRSTKRIVYPAKNSFICAMSSVAGTKLGYSPTFTIVDEYLVQDDHDLWNTISSGGGARKETFTFIISTAGDDRTSPIYDEFCRAKKIAADPSLDKSYLPVLYYADPDEPWDDERTWKKCNPALDDFANLEWLRMEAVRARELPYEERKFKQFYLNQFVDVSEANWIPADAWQKCKADLPDLHGRGCWGAVDLSKVSDLTAFSLVFPLDDGQYAVKSWAWIPGDTLRKHERKDHANYWQWVREGWLRTCKGEVIDYHQIKDDLLALFDEYRPKQILWDRYGADFLVQGLAAAGVPMFQFGQGTASMSQPTKEMERLVLSGKLLHDGNPVLAWCVANVRLEISGTELVKPNKGRSTGRIDCAVATIMALAGAMQGAKQSTSIFSSRGFVDWAIATSGRPTSPSPVPAH